MENHELLALNAQGVFPGPGETEEAFEQRVTLTRKNFHCHSNPLPPHRWDWAAQQLRALFDFSPRWCIAFFSARRLAPWQAAATWIEADACHAIQLRPSRWVEWFVNIDEILAHEAVHAARAAFQEPKYEEMLAYMTATARWRRTWGPIVRRPFEVWLPVGCMFLGTLFSAWPILSDGCFCLGLGLCLAGVGRLLRGRRQLNRAALSLRPFLKDPEKARAVLLRLTDGEIDRFAQNEIGFSISGQTELRWRLLKEAYFKDHE